MRNVVAARLAVGVIGGTLLSLGLSTQTPAQGACPKPEPREPPRLTLASTSSHTATIGFAPAAFLAPAWQPVAWEFDVHPYEGGEGPSQHRTIEAVSGTTTFSELDNKITYFVNASYSPVCGSGRVEPSMLWFLIGVRAGVSADKTVIDVGQAVHFDASQSVAGEPPLSFTWDLDGDGSFETEGGATATRTFTTPDVNVVSVRVRQHDGLSDTASVIVRSFAVPPTPDTGVSINNGEPYTNDKSISLSLSWPRHASGVRVSNDGGFADARSFELGEQVPWTLDNSVKGLATKVVYVRFRGAPSVDPTKTYSDDIILDAQPPVVQKATAVQVAGESNWIRGSSAKPPKRRTYRVRVRAKDRLTGVTALKLNTREGATKPRPYKANVKITLPQSRQIVLRVRDGAGNWTRWMKLEVRKAGVRP